MRSITRPISAFLTAIYLGAGSPVLANCAALQPLAVIHDAYRAVLSDATPHTKALAANQLINTVPIYGGNAFKAPLQNMQLDIDFARLEKIINDAFFVGRDTLAGRNTQVMQTERHFENAKWMTSIVSRTGCFTTHNSGGNSLGGLRTLPGIANTSKATTPSNLPLSREMATGVLTTFLALVVAGLAGYLIYYSRPLRIKRVVRLPRHSVAFRAKANFGTGLSNTIVVDISMGGAKIECDHPPIEKESITLHLPNKSVPATIMWATAFYAGVMFEEQLSEEELDIVINHEGVTTRSRLSNVF